MRQELQHLAGLRFLRHSRERGNPDADSMTLWILRAAERPLANRQ
jgi:hypothetical protein